ncbi:MAG TPA: DUF4294 domain-containing protein [Mucilaginibacter sp.]|jgi:hypothetical protein|nr:DUF4294 domain-containing protein [Mucilaginibacter sp.]
MKFIGLLLLFCCMVGMLKAQPAQPGKPEPKPAPLQLGKNDTIPVYLTIDSGKLMPWIVTPDVIIADSRIFKSEADRYAFKRLKYNVLKVLPYASFAGKRYRKLQRDLAVTADKRQQKILITQCEAEIKALFDKEIKELTITQGDILIKLIDRETGNTSYDMVKDMKGGFKAFVYQSVARLFGHDLKDTYDPDEERDIEAILLQAGYHPSND